MVVVNTGRAAVSGEIPSAILKNATATRFNENEFKVFNRLDILKIEFNFAVIILSLMS